jgi:N-acetylglucosaminyl-diphospho-decaprenol L-rhamnosyltransferase
MHVDANGSTAGGDDRPTVDVVIPTHGGWAITERCLLHLREQTRAHRVVVVDDVSPDDTVARIRAGFPEVELLVLERNVGYGSACNRGVAHGDSEFVVLMNSDVEAEPAMLERLLAPLEQDATLGSASPLLLRPDGTIDAFGICADVTAAGFLRLPGQPPSAVDGPTPALLGPYGAVAAFRRSALDQVGLLDERIFMYGEELDLALRLRGAGWGATAVADARGVHLGGATIGVGSAKQRRNSGFGRGYLLRAYGILRGRHGPRALLVELIVCVGDAIRSRDLEATRGRWAGWRAGRDADSRPRTGLGVDRSIGTLRSLRMRLGG